MLEREHEKIGGPVEIKAEDTGATPTGATAMEVDSKPSLASPTPKGPANSSPTNTPPKAAAASPAATPLEVSKGGERIVPISQVNPYVRSTIKGQVVSKDEMRTFTVMPPSGASCPRIAAVPVDRRARAGALRGWRLVGRRAATGWPRRCSR